MGALSVVGQPEVHIWKKLWWANKLDVNLIAAERLTPFLYPFYTTGLSFKYTREIELGIILTNKSMNLDVHYNTFYLTRHPYAGVLLVCKELN